MRIAAGIDDLSVKGHILLNAGFIVVERPLDGMQLHFNRRKLLC